MSQGDRLRVMLPAGGSYRERATGGGVGDDYEPEPLSDADREMWAALTPAQREKVVRDADRRALQPKPPTAEEMIAQLMARVEQLTAAVAGLAPARSPVSADTVADDDADVDRILGECGYERSRAA